MKKLGQLLFIFCLLIAFAGNAFAERDDVRFLNEYGVNLYERGDYAQATQQFQRVLTIEPKNTTALKYLELIEADDMSFSRPKTRLTQVSELGDDIRHINENILRYERKNRDLEFIVRDLISENDILYKTLSQRNKEVVSLREQLQQVKSEAGVDSEAAKTSAADVTDRAEEVSKLLKSYEKQLVERDRMLVEQNEYVRDLRQEISEVQDMVDKITSSNDLEALNGQLAKDNQHLDILYETLTAKRDYLVNKMLTLIEKSHQLQEMRSELVSMKQAVSQPVVQDAADLEKFDQRLAEVSKTWKEKSEIDQKEIRRLTQALERKTEELNAIQQGLTTGQARVGEIQHELRSRDQQIAELNRLTLERDTEISKMRDVLTKFKLEIEDKTRTIAEQSETIDYADGAIGRVDDRVGSIKGVVDATGRNLNQLKDSVGKVKDTIVRQREQLKEKEQTLANVQSQLNNAQTSLEDLRQRVGEKDKSVEHLQNLVNELQAERDKYRDEIAQTGQRLNEAETMLTDWRSELQAMRKESELKDFAYDQLKARFQDIRAKLQERDVQDAAKEQQIQNLKDQVAGLEKQVSELQASAGTGSPVSGHYKQTAETLIQKQDQKIGYLQGHLEVKDQQLKLQEQRVNVLKKQVNILREKTEILTKNVAPLPALPQERETVSRAEARRLSEKNAQIETLSSEVRELRARFSEAMSLLEEQRREAEKIAKTLASNGRKLKDDKEAELQARLTDLSQQVNAHDEVVNALKTTLSAKDQQLSDLKEQLAASQGQLQDQAALKDRVGFLEEQLSRSEADATAKSATIAMLQGMVDDLQKQPAAPVPESLSQAAAEDLQRQLEGALKNIEDKSQRVTSLEKQILELEERLLAKDRTLRSLQAGGVDIKDQASVDAATEELAGIGDLEKELNDARLELKLTKDTVNKQVRALEDLEKRLDERDRALLDQQNSTSKMEWELSAVEKKLKETEAAMADKDAELRLARSQLEEAQQELKTFAADSDDRQVQKLQQRLGRAEETIAAQENALQHERGRVDNLLKELEAAQAGGNIRTAAVAQADISSEAMNEQIRASHEALQNATTRIESLEARLKEKEQMIETQTAYARQLEERMNAGGIDRLTGELDSVQEDIASLASELEKANEAVILKNEELNQARKDVQALEVQVNMFQAADRKKAAQLANLNEELFNAAKHISRQEEALSKEQERLDALTQALEESREELVKKEEQLSQQAQALEHLQARLSENVMDSDLTNPMPSVALDNLKSKLGTAQQQLTEVQTQYKVTQTELRNARIRVDNLEKLLENKERETELQRRRIEELEQQL